MNEIQQHETRIEGQWLFDGQTMKEDESCHRIRSLINDQLQRVATDQSGWDVLYKDPSDGRFWELIYPQSEMHGGGPPVLQLVSVKDAKVKYGDV